MTNLIQNLRDRKLLQCEAWIPDNVQYLTIMGSQAYGVANTSAGAMSDVDVYGFCIPPKDIIFPHLSGHIQGFGTPPPNFKQLQKHHIDDPSQRKEWDITVYNIVTFFELCRGCNPNMIDALYTPENCVLHCTEIGQIVRENRHLFLSKLAWKRFRGYAFEQMRKMRFKTAVGKRLLLIEKYGFDVKYAYHVVRLLDEAEQILLEGTLDLQRAKEVMKSIRNGEWTIERIEDFFAEKDKALETFYTNCKLPTKPDEEALKNLLIRCLEHHYGSMEKCITSLGWAEEKLRSIDNILNEVRSKLY